MTAIATTETSTTTTCTVDTSMRDGVVLTGRLHRTTDDPRPVLLVRTPYNEAMSRSLPIVPALESGFSVLVQNCRGTATSGGRLRAFESEKDDGEDTIAWLVDQTWCDGRVVMLGTSYLGMTQLAAAACRPPGLVAIAPMLAPHDYRDGLVFRQGAYCLGQGLSWHLLKTGELLRDAAGRGEDIVDRAVAFRALSTDLVSAYHDLPLLERPAIEALVPSWRTWLAKEADAAYWRAISYAPQRASTAVPALHVAGWFDIFLRGTLDNYSTMSAGDAAAAQAQRLIVGPWSHPDQTGVVGERVHSGAAAAVIGLENQQLSFLRAAVDEVPSSLPPVQIYVMGDDKWRTENEWPLARTRWEDWHLGADGSLGPEPAEPGERGFVHDPGDPVPTIGGATLIAGTPTGDASYQPGPRDQRPLDGRRDILRFASAPLVDDLEVTGPLQLCLYASTSAVDTDFTAKLIDVHPDGRALSMCDGIVRARYRNGMDESSMVEPGEIVRYVIDLGATSQVFRAGHRIRVDIASSDFPNFDSNSGSGKNAGDVTVEDRRIAHQRVFSGPATPSAIRLPVIPRTARTEERTSSCD